MLGMLLKFWLQHICDRVKPQTAAKTASRRPRCATTVADYATGNRGSSLPSAQTIGTQRDATELNNIVNSHGCRHMAG